MVPCGVCSNLPEETDAVHCSGSCGKRFHYRCVDLGQRDLDSLADNIGLFWFCSTCRLELRSSYQIEPILKTDTDSTGSNSDQLSATMVDELVELPTEVWEEIFDFLEARDLLQTRAVCQRWKQITDGRPQLLQKLELRFPEGTAINQSYMPSGFWDAKRLELRRTKLTYAGLWWTVAWGHCFTSLTISQGSFTLPALLTMLRYATNLKQFKLTYSGCSFDSIPRTKFKLEKMEQFTVRFVDYEQSKLLDVFKWIFPRLKIFTVDMDYYERKLFSFVETRQDTLQELDFSPKHNLLTRIGQLERLRLKRLVLGQCSVGIDVQQMVEASRLQPDIERLNMHALCVRELESMQSLEEICRNLPKLKRLAVSTGTSREEATVPTFLKFTPLLEHLTITAYRNTINFEGYKCNTLKELFVGSLYPVGNSLQRFLEECPNIRSLILGLIYYPTKFFENKSEDEKRQLELRWDAPQDSTEETRPKSFEKLKVLKLYQNEIPKEILLKLLNMCPHVEELDLIGTKDEELDDEVVLMVCQKLCSLRLFRLSHITDTFAMYIVEHCHALKYLEVHNWEKLSPDAEKQLTYCRNIKLQRFSGYFHYEIEG